MRVYSLEAQLTGVFYCKLKIRMLRETWNIIYWFMGFYNRNRDISSYCDILAKKLCVMIRLGLEN